MLLKIHQFYSAKNTQRDTHKSRKLFFLNWKQQKTIILNRKPFNQKIEEIFFRKNFSMKVYGKSHSAENLEQSFMLAKRFVSSKSREGFDKNIRKKVAWCLKNVLKTNSHIACWFTHNAENCKRRDPLCFLKIEFVAKL